MTILNVRHTTTYRYRRPVRLGEHRLMLRPRDSHDLRLLEIDLRCSPSASIRWLHDVFGNSIAVASFVEPAAELRIESLLRLETFAVQRPAFRINPEAVSYPFVYSADDRIDLGRLLDRQYPDPTDRVGSWARGFVRSNPTDTLALLADLNSGIAAWISYQSREAEGTQTPVETLNRGCGSCLLLPSFRGAVHRGSTLRRLWSPRRVRISVQPLGRNVGRRDDARLGRHLRAGLGLDRTRSTNGTINSGDLIRVAVTRDIGQAIPIVGSFAGAPDSYLGMTVEVAVAPEFGLAQTRPTEN